jgi:hypothetical protein
MPKLTPEGGQILERDALAFDAIERAEVHEGAIQCDAPPSARQAWPCEAWHSFVACAQG